MLDTPGLKMQRGEKKGTTVTRATVRCGKLKADGASFRHGVQGRGDEAWTAVSPDKCGKA